jgi:diketogulonate reductase-like aldo/keto reductase
MYGAAESVVGRLAGELGLHERLFFATKVWTSGRAEGIHQMEASFKRMRVQRMDLLQVHNLVDVETHTRTLLEMKAAQKTRYIGITHYAASAHGEAARWLRTGQYDFLQINYSLAERDADKALAVWREDAQIDAMYNSLFRELLTYMMEDPRNIGPCTHLMFIAKNIERIGDHATNVAELVYFLVHGHAMDQARPKVDTTNVAVPLAQSSAHE